MWHRVAKMLGLGGCVIRHGLPYTTLLQEIDLIQRLVQSSYDEYLISANESDEVFTDDQLKQLNYDFDSDALMF